MQNPTRFPNILSLIFCLLLSIALLPMNYAFARQTATASQASAKTIQLKGLKDNAVIRRDERGIPYVEAKTEEDLYFAQGYATASDRLWQMDLFRRLMRGEVAEIFGRAPFANGTTVDQDRLHRTYGWARMGDTMVAACSPQLRAALESYARGVNAYINSLDEKSLPPEFQILRYKPREWTAADSLVAGKVFAESLSMTWEADIMRVALQDLPAEKREKLLMKFSPDDVVVVGNDGEKPKTAHPASTARLTKQESVALLEETRKVQNALESALALVGFYAEDRAASNNWVVSGKRTASGKPLLANDPHLLATAPSIWHMVHLAMPGMRVAGVTTPGFPGVLIGHNEHIAWGATNLGPDVQDVYLETFDPQNPRRYKTPSGWQEAEIRREEIKVRKGPLSNETDIETVDVTVTRHGPIVLEKDGRRYALRWTAFNPQASDAEGFFRINHAKNWKEFTEALGHYKGITFNFVYADVEGNIGYYGAGLIPIRKKGDGSLPYDGSTDDGEWTGYIPLAELPHLYNPPEGIIVTANQRVVGKSYKRHLTHEWPSPYRARRITELLSSNPKQTPDTFRDIQADVFNIHFSTFARETLKLLDPMPPTTLGNEDKLFTTLYLLKSWDGRMTVDSKAAPLVAAMRVAFRQKIFNAALGQERARIFRWNNESAFFNWLIQARPIEWLPKEYKDYAALLRDCEKEARAALAQRIGPDETQWTWGKYATARVSHPLAAAPLVGQQFAIAPFQINGGSNVPNVGVGVSMRFIASPDNWDASRMSITLGVSGLPQSQYWKDQMRDWLNATPRVFPFTQTAVEKTAKETLTIEPMK
jgi:penicillin amidase